MIYIINRNQIIKKLAYITSLEEIQAEVCENDP